MIVVSSLKALQIGGLKWHESIHILPLDPSIINMCCTNATKVSSNGFESSVHVLMILTIMHIEPFGLIAQGIKSISLHTLISNKSVGESIPCFLGGGELLNVRHLFFSHCLLEHVQGHCIELTINHLSSCQVERINGLVPNFNNSPQFNARTIPVSYTHL